MKVCFVVGFDYQLRLSYIEFLSTCFFHKYYLKCLFLYYVDVLNGLDFSCLAKISEIPLVQLLQRDFSDSKFLPCFIHNREA